MSKKRERYDLYTFVAGAAMEKDIPFQLTCNCGGKITIMPPFQDEYVVCPDCESKIKIMIIEGDPGYIIGKTTEGELTLLPVQGSSAPHPNTLTKEKHETILSDLKDKINKKEK